MNGSDLPGYETLRSGPCLWRVRPGLAAALAVSPAAALLEGDPPGPGRPGTGRSGAMALQLAGHPAWAKRGVHGGLARRVLGGLFWRDRRGRRVIEAAERLRAAGVPTPGVLAAGWRTIAGPFAAYVLVTEAIPDGTTLQAFLTAQPLARRRRRLARAAGRSVRALHDAGFVHADLNLANLVAARGGEPDVAGGEAQVFVIDLDGGCFRPLVGYAGRRSNLARLLRSYEKWIAPKSRLDRRDALAFLRAYCGGDRQVLRRLARDLGGLRFRWRRLLWPRGAA